MRRMIGCFAAALLLLPCAAAAQPPAPTSAWAHGTTVNAFAGGAAESSRTRALLGGSFGWEITPGIGIEASGSWLDRGTDADAFLADLTGQVALTPPTRIVPFVEGGIGFYRATFGQAATDIPAFYRRRLMGQGFMAASKHTFTDPAFVFGGGVNIYLNRHVAIRPTVNAIVVHRDAANHTLAEFAVHLAYHFEQHPLIAAGGRTR
jgi:Outer membrane protein beta-barrel domain